MKQCKKTEKVGVSVSIDKELNKTFTAFCKSHGLSKSFVVGQAIKQYMKNPVNKIKLSWIEHQHERGPDWEYSLYECPYCHAFSDDDTDYCPHCGGKIPE